MQTKKNTGKAIINDVAEAAGVSIKTVSRVLNNEANVRDATRDRVQQAIEKLDYKPNLSARGLANNHSSLIGIVYDKPTANYIDGLQQGALKGCHKKGYLLLVEYCDVENKHFAQQIEKTVSQANLDGIILTPPLSDCNPLLDMLEHRNVPYVLIAPELNLQRGPSVYIDDQKAAFDMTEYLIKLGHNDIAFIKGHPDHAATAKRYQGFCDAMAKHQLKINQQFIAQGYFSYRSGMTCAEYLLSQDQKPTAIFSSDDEMAAGVIVTAHRYGINVPIDLSVVGFDDSTIAQTIWPPLTTVKQPLYNMANTAVGLLTYNIEAQRENTKEQPKNETQLLDYEIVIRESSAPPNLPHINPPQP